MKQELKEQLKGLCCVEISGESCANCLTLMPILQDLCAARDDIKLVHIEADYSTTELMEELNWDVLPLDIIYQLKTPKITLYFVRVIPAGNTIPTPCEGQQIKWETLSPEFPCGMLENDRNFWKFITS